MVSPMLDELATQSPLPKRPDPHWSPPPRDLAATPTTVFASDAGTETRTAARILIVENNVHFAATLRSNLEIEGFLVDLATNAPQAHKLICAFRPALVLLDVVLPGRDGFEFLRMLRTEGIDVPVVLLTARRDEEDKLRGFGLGADDFVTKPVSFLELVARIRAVLRRTHQAFDASTHWLQFGDVEVHPPTRTVRRQGSVVSLRPKEFDLLLALMRQRDRVVSRAELLRDVWGYRSGIVSRTVDTHMAGLRQKLECEPLNPQYLLTVRAAGYMLRWHGENLARGA